MITIAVLGTFDTKGMEHAFVAQQIQELGHRTLLIDVGTNPPQSIVPDITREQVVGTDPLVASSLNQSEPLDRGAAIAQVTQAIPSMVRKLASEDRIHGIISLGGSGGTAIGTAAMRALPIGFPKVMVSTMAGGNVTQYVELSDIVMFPSIVDVSGLNRISTGVFSRAASAVVAMAHANANGKSKQEAKPLIVASMFGNTTPCIQRAKKILEEAGYEVLVFHATGAGGRTMESIIESGIVAGVLDVTTTEWADQLVGGVMGGGQQRLEAAARRGIPAVVAPGCLDMVNFGEPSSIPERFRGRTFYQHNPHVTLMRTTPEECRELGRIIAEKLNLSSGPIHVAFPLRAISVISSAGKSFHHPAADLALRESLKSSLRPDIAFEELDCEINDETFADHCAGLLLKVLQRP